MLLPTGDQTTLANDETAKVEPKIPKNSAFFRLTPKSYLLPHPGKLLSITKLPSAI